MRPSKFTDEQIGQALKQVKAGTPAVEVCRRLGITQTTFYRWRAKFDKAGIERQRENKDLRDENRKLREIVANLVLERETPNDTRRRK